MNVHTRIAAVIADSGLSKTAFAQRLGLSQSYVSNVALGTKVPSDRTIADICREFSVREEWLRTGEGEMYILTDAETELANFCADVLSGVSGPNRRRLVSLLAGLSDEEIAIYTRLLDTVAAKWQKEIGTD